MNVTIAVFTKNLTNPAYEAFRIAADQVARTAGARIVHFVAMAGWIVMHEA